MRLARWKLDDCVKRAFLGLSGKNRSGFEIQPQTGCCFIGSMADDAVRRQNRLYLLLEINGGSAERHNRREPDEQLAGHGQISLVMPGRGIGCTGWLIFHSRRAGNRTS